MEPDDSLPHSHVPSTCPYPEHTVQVLGFLCEHFLTRHLFTERSC